MTLVTWDQCKAELGLSGDEQQTVVMQKADHATSIVLNRIQGYIARVQPEWDDQTDPTTDPVLSQVQAAILAQLSALYRFRGDDEGRERESTVSKYDLDPIVVRIVAQIEDPTCA